MHDALPRGERPISDVLNPKDIRPAAKLQMSLAENTGNGRPLRGIASGSCLTAFGPLGVGVALLWPDNKGGAFDQ